MGIFTTRTTLIMLQNSDYQRRVMEECVNKLMEFFAGAIVITVDSEGGESIVRYNKDGNCFAVESALRAVSKSLTRECQQSIDDMEDDE